jgi:DNA-directed RNA polymerase subunit RPC12/RpoP
MVVSSFIVVKKLTIEHAKKVAAAKGGKCLSEVYVKSQAKLDWQCAEGHTWAASLNQVKDRRSWCPYCSGHRLTKSRSLARVNPAVAKEWHPSRNQELTPSDVSFGSNKKVWWLCEKGHEWKAAPNSRSQGDGCPYCAGHMIDESNCLASTNPKLTEEWHPTKNGDLTPQQVSKGAHKKVWWKCQFGHSWQAMISNRTRGRNCPYCSCKLASPEHCLAAVDPEQSKEWHPALNGKLTPFDVTPSSNKKVWWRCKEGHEWQAMVNAKKGCGVCANRIVGPENNLAFINPDLATQWHPTRNGDLTPSDVVPGSARKVWWKCPRGHSWRATLVTRHRQSSGCPKCSNQTSKPELRIYAELSGLFENVRRRAKIHGQEIDVFLPDYNLGVEFDGYHFHQEKFDADENKTKILSDKGVKIIRVRERPLNRISSDDIFIKRGKLTKSDVNRLLQVIYPALSKSDKSKIPSYLESKIFKYEAEFRSLLSELPGPGADSSVKSLYPKLVAEWHYEKNDPLSPESFAIKSSQIVWWKCALGHEWKATIATRTSGVGCPYCSGRRTTRNRSLALKKPDLAKQWHPTKNGNLKPTDVSPGSKKRVWWICKKKHYWGAVVYSRSAGTGCPYCSNKKVGFGNDLLSTNPSLAEQWHPTLNGKLMPSGVTCNSNKKAWWKCRNGHEWQATIYSRNSGKGCRKCFYQKN